MGSKIKDYIIDVEKKEEEVVKDKKTVKRTFSPTVELVLSNNTDVVIRKKFKNETKELVIIPMKNCYYIKTINKKGEESIESFDVDETLIKLKYITSGYGNGGLKGLKAFCCDYNKDLPIWVRFLNSNLYEQISKSNSHLYGRVDFENLLSVDFMKFMNKYLNREDYKSSIIFSDNTIVNCLSGRSDTIYYYYKLDKNKFDLIYNAFETKYNVKNYASLFVFDINHIKYFIERLRERDVINSNMSFLKGEVSFDFFGYRRDNYKDVIKNLDQRMFINYLFDVITRECIDITIPIFFTDYVDYLSMQKKMFRKVKNKYPKNFLTEKHKTITQFNEFKRVVDDKSFKEKIKMEEYSSLIYSGDVYGVIAPKNSDDVKEEGINLSHCVKNYIDNIIDGTSKILFMRENDSVDESLITIEVRNNLIVQVRGAYNRRPVSEEREFIVEWAKEKNLIINY